SSWKALRYVLGGSVQCFSLRKRDLFSVRESTLDMALSSFDDQYKDCASMMEAELGELNRTELANNRNYAETWLEAASSWKEMKDRSYVPRDFKPEYAIAILAYTSQGPLHKQPLHQEFNAAVREAGRTRDFYLNNFNFKTLHFLLTRALHVLKASEPTKCHQVYRGVRGIRFKAESRKPVRFGHFTSTSLKNESALNFGQDTFFSIKTCYGVNIKNFSLFPGEDEVLIPPFEKFKVTNFTRAQDRTLIQLLSLDSYSNHNCEYVKGNPHPAQWGPDLGWGLLGSTTIQIIACLVDEKFTDPHGLVGPEPVPPAELQENDVVMAQSKGWKRFLLPRDPPCIVPPCHPQ
uniref:NAD(P)(+)--arginine ADP-ribosyltransferase n=1 Tax=Terrapene triunguis TaxID=2587831 RepID=A0A674I868_9SAUR